MKLLAAQLETQWQRTALNKSASAKPSKLLTSIFWATPANGSPTGRYLNAAAPQSRPRLGLIILNVHENAVVGK